MDRIDLHIHSVYSDGTLTPTEIAERAKARGCAAISLTDHDTMDGVPECEAAAESVGLELVCGCEISTYYGPWQIHILAYLMDSQSRTLVEKFSELALKREERNREMLAALARIGINISADQIRSAAGRNIITRAHFARVLCAQGYAASIQDAFDRYVSPGGAAFVPHEAMTARDCIEFIRGEGGAPVMAHPFLYKMDESYIDRFVGKLASDGLMGIEAFYTSHSPSQTALARRLANKYRLVETGGSDFHGEDRPHTEIGVGRGNLFVPYSVIDNLHRAIIAS